MGLHGFDKPGEMHSLAVNDDRSRETRAAVALEIADIRREEPDAPGAVVEIRRAVEIAAADFDVSFIDEHGGRLRARSTREGRLPLILNFAPGLTRTRAQAFKDQGAAVSFAPLVGRAPHVELSLTQPHPDV